FSFKCGFPPINHWRATCPPSAAASSAHWRCANVSRRAASARGSGPSAFAHRMGSLRSFDPASAATRVGPRAAFSSRTMSWMSWKSLMVGTPGAVMLLEPVYRTVEVGLAGDVPLDDFEAEAGRYG